MKKFFSDIWQWLNKDKNDEWHLHLDAIEYRAKKKTEKIFAIDKMNDTEILREIAKILIDKAY